MKREVIKSWFVILVVISFFILASYIVQSNLEYFQKLIGNDLGGMGIYVLILVVSVVVAPVSAIPLLPVASNLWGWVVAGILSIIGWWIGAMIAFGLARVYGVPLVKKIVPLEKIARVERLIPEQNIFFGVVFLRMAVPVDILSYVLGLFSYINFKKYALATLIGISPFAFVFAYIGTLPIVFQIIALVVAIFIIYIGYFTVRFWKRRKL